jgi:hypothetical protein
MPPNVMFLSAFLSQQGIIKENRELFEENEELSLSNMKGCS